MLVEPTRSQNITVIGRRSAPSADEDKGGGLVGFVTGQVAPRLAIALSRRLRSPRLTPSWARSPSVRSGRTSASIELSLNATSYRPRPRLRSQTPTSIDVSSEGRRSMMVLRNHNVYGFGS